MFVPSLPLACFVLLRAAGAQASSFVSFASESDRAQATPCPAPPLPLPLPSRLCLAASLSLCLVWGREKAALRCAALRCVACFSWPHACYMFEHALHAGVGHSSRQAGRHTSSPLSTLFAPPPASLRQWKRLHLLRPPYCSSCCFSSPPLRLHWRSSPPRASTMKVLSPSLTLFLSMVFVLVLFFSALALEINLALPPCFAVS